MNLIRIGTRNSPLAIWQAREVEKKLQKLGLETEIVPIISHGDKNLIQPLYKMNIVGVFTKDLDIALLNGEIDIAVHSLKDVPTQLPENICLSAVLERDYEEDILIRSTHSKNKNYEGLHIGTGSLRRRAFWKSAYPEVKFSNIRGNIQTRLKKLEEEKLDGTLFSLAGIKRLKMPLNYEILDFIIPAPGQGVIGITSLQINQQIQEILTKMDHLPTKICIELEREFLQVLEGGCTAPIGAIMKIEEEDKASFVAGIVSLDGRRKVFLKESFNLSDYKNKGRFFAEKAKKNGANEIIREIKKSDF